MDKDSYESTTNAGMGLLFGPDERERELWKSCDVKLRNNLSGLVNSSFLMDMKKDDEAEREKWADILFDKYSDIVQRYENIDVSRLDGRFKPDVISRVYEKLLGAVYVLTDSGKLHAYIKEEIDPLMTEFFTPRYQAFRDSMGNAYELERK